MTAFEYKSQVVNHFDYIRQFAFRYTRDPEKANDLAQETMYKALANYDKFRTNTNLKGWMKVIMKNTFINEYRKMGNYMISYNSDNYYTTVGRPDTYLPDNIMMSGQIEGLIDKLDDSVRIPFMMHFEGYKYHEIAEKMDIKMGTVKSRIHQARKILSLQLTSK